MQVLKKALHGRSSLQGAYLEALEASVADAWSAKIGVTRTLDLHDVVHGLRVHEAVNTWMLFILASCVREPFFSRVLTPRPCHRVS